MLYLTGYRKLSAEPQQQAKSLSAFAQIICRDRYQILIALALAIGVPMIIRGLLTGTTLTQPNQYTTATAASMAIIFGYISFRKIRVFPGITSSGYIATSLTMWFGLVSALFVFLRLEYTTVQLFAGYAIALIWFTFINLFFVNRSMIRLGVVPSPATARLPQVRRVEWVPIPSHDAAAPSLNGVVVDLHESHSDAWSNRIAAFALEGVPVYHFKEAIENLLGQVEIEKLSENTLGSLNPNDVYLSIKSFLDRVGASIIVLLISPLLLLIAAAIRIDSSGPVLFRQQRMGFRKRQFTVFKFRTMFEGSGVADQRVSAITLDHDPRITRMGRYLRKYRLDELPQLFNIVRGEMSLIGPRPEAIALAEWYEKEIPFYHYRHIIRPGITGWAQVNQGHVSDVTAVTRKLHLDFYYVKNFSFWLDVFIALKTLRVMLVGQGAK
jgi:lipopolysaccharide/colanic/teichoic acid biosynthesis glycosyltransferase